jgi:ribosomal protein S18 acetylase RimI-like enzyme
MTVGHSEGRSALVTVRPMTADEFDNWRERSIRGFADDFALATGRHVEAAAEHSRGLFGKLLPDGLDTDGTWLLKVLDETRTEVGTLWVGPHPERTDTAYVYDIEILETHRGRGLGRAAMTAAERLVGDAGIGEIGLNVFGFNVAARRLYDSLGYRVVATQMAKSLARTRPENPTVG